MKTSTDAMPRYLAGYEALYRKSPRQANLQWFREAGYGLFLHYGLYLEAGRGKHLTVEQVVGKLKGARGQACNLLLNTGPLPDGSLDPEDVETILRAGDLIRAQGVLKPS